MLEQIVKDIANTVKDSVQAGIKTLSDKIEPRLNDLENRVKSIPHPEKGEDGKSVTVEDVRPLLEEMVAAIPVPKDGKDGNNGKDGADGKSITIDDVMPLVEKAVKQIPVPKDGKDGSSPTADQVAASMEGLFSKWALDFERKADLVLEKAVDRMPKPKDGEDGRDALEIEDFDLTLGEDGRTVTASLKRGDIVIEKSIYLPIPLDKGVYRDGEQYKKGDGVTYGGSFWIAQKDAPEGKPSTGEDWRLSVKRGRDGRESVKLVKDDSKVKI